MTSETTSLQIMLVDDDLDNVSLMAELLESAGHVVQVESEAAHAIEKACGNTFDVCILDIGMPVINGHQLARRLRLMPEMDSVMLIAATGYGGQLDIEDSLDAGFDYHFVKPVQTKRLMSLLNYVAKEKLRSNLATG